ncbi:hypothetical protein [Oceanibaculum pacificum]|uniref:Uncharacterized protein n=1 Tax=Oceanibaculum pacificum TaxID=580166 RepID=A0A154WFV5_9PROT|nr:hypothetical protein [Oceanibaculum pacificum]KZD12408.1 hypothetical protein AUP43_16455 [Oceanibaculum pacificum]
MSDIENDNIGGELLPPPVITVDYDLYAHYLEESDLSEDQKREFLQALWNLVVSFVSLGFGVHPAQQVEIACGKLFKSSSKPLRAESDRRQCEDQHRIKILANGADPEAGKRKEGSDSCK